MAKYAEGLSEEVSEKILRQLDECGYLFEGYKLCLENDRIKSLGGGGFSEVVEMYSTDKTEKRYALKVIGFGEHDINTEKFKEAFRLQNYLCMKSEYIVRTLNSKVLAVRLSTSHAVEDVLELKGEDTEHPEGYDIILKFVQMERLDPIIGKDRFGNVFLIKKELLAEREILHLMIDIGNALSVIHNNSIIHRDVKLENIFWDEKTGLYKLGDFGMAKQIRNGNAETIIYSDGYGAPEMVRLDESDYNCLVDIYSFGITVYVLLNGLKFPGSDSYNPKPNIQYNSDIVLPAPSNASERMVRIVQKMCAYNVCDRYSSVKDIFRDLYSSSREKEHTPYAFSAVSDMETEIYRDEDESYINETETYSEENEASLDETETYYVEAADGDILDDSVEEDDKQLTRAERIKREREFQEIGKGFSKMTFLVLTVLLILFFKGMKVDGALASGQLIWFLVPAMVFEAVLQKLKEFDILFGIVSIILICASVKNYTEMTPLHITMVLCVILHIPALTMAGGVSAFLWLLIEKNHILTFLDFLGEIDAGWVFLVLTVAVVVRFIGFCEILDNLSSFTELIYDIFGKIALGLAALGIVLLVLEKCSVLTIPDFIERLHLIRTGLLLFAVHHFILWHDWGEI